ncbi:Glyoxalase-like domain-containing protein [Micromonospora rhizosphaerae]|uniref:Bleomycin resistance protein n=1 Tax=Micromonospora rhizosphaerae TaxID=568872 RepID=A0A1C6SR23_9ACTN|nr:VOC family protein [Micromonospora rhizosphaerae]SCL32000.1 Glyoxalase-like domain-containing protein [Micromonospora rhizosphaerae]
MTAAAETVRESDHEHCGCCGRQLPKSEVVELGNTPGVFICVGCAIWAARRAGPAAALRQLRFTPLGTLVRRLAGSSTGAGPRAAIPILPSTDLDRTAAFYVAAGFTETGRHQGYLLMHNNDVELHFSLEPTDPAPGQCFIHVTDALKLWKQLRHHATAGVGPIADQDYGLREFVLTDPDGNRVRFGSPAR